MKSYEERLRILKEHYYPNGKESILKSSSTYVKIKKNSFPDTDKLTDLDFIIHPPKEISLERLADVQGSKVYNNGALRLVRKGIAEDYLDASYRIDMSYLERLNRLDDIDVPTNRLYAHLVYTVKHIEGSYYSHEKRKVKTIMLTQEALQTPDTQAKPYEQLLERNGKSMLYSLAENKEGLLNPTHAKFIKDILDTGDDETYKRNHKVSTKVFNQRVSRLCDKIISLKLWEK